MTVRGAALGLVVAFAARLAAAAPPPDIAEALERIRETSSIELTTVGRKTGKPHTKPIWFVVADGTIFVQAGRDGRTDWYQNLRKTPEATLRSGEDAFRVRATPVDDPARVEEIHRLFLDKYLSAWLLSYLGSRVGQGRPAALVPLSVVTGAPPAAP